jgi:hypothetical protein
MGLGFIAPPNASIRVFLRPETSQNTLCRVLACTGTPTEAVDEVLGELKEKIYRLWRQSGICKVRLPKSMSRPLLTANGKAVREIGQRSDCRLHVDLETDLRYAFLFIR